MLRAKNYLKKNFLFLLASFFIPAVIMAAVYFTIGVYPGGEKTVLVSDSFGQFSNFYASYRDVLAGEQSFLYTWSGSLGLNYLALAAYYLGGLFTPLVVLFPKEQVAVAMYFITLIKIGTAGVSFYFFANQTYRISRLSQLALSVSYSLMSFITAHSELLMWLDAFIYLPLITLGIHRVMDQKKSPLLFMSYLLLFLSNFYMGFMIGVFSVLYYIARLLTNRERYQSSILTYAVTSLLAGGASMIVILPTVLDLRMNGEELAKVFRLKTSASGFWDLVMKNMIGVYDTTKNGSIPFIYIGLFPLLLCVYYFVSRRISKKKKIAYGSIFLILTASFYLVPLNLFWHGMDSPNMFHFRYSYLFSFLVIVLAGYAWELVNEKEAFFTYFPLGYLAVTVVASVSHGVNKYQYISAKNFFLTAIFLLLYFACLFFRKEKGWSLKLLTIGLFGLMTIEAAVNTHGIINGLLNDWGYGAQARYNQNYDQVKSLVDQTQEENDTFFRLENLDALTSNDSFRYGYHGVSMFSSIRNRNTSGYLHTLGYRSRGSNLTIRYLNNTLLMDSIVGMKYNIKQDTLGKFGFKQINKLEDHYLYENSLNLPLAFAAEKDIYALKTVPDSNLVNQKNLFNQLSGLDQKYFSFKEPVLVSQSNVTIEKKGNVVAYSPQEKGQPKVLVWEIEVPSHTQAYVSLYPTNFSELGTASVKINVNRYIRRSLIGANGQYHNVGYYPQKKKIRFTTTFYASDDIHLVAPKVMFLNTRTFRKAAVAIQQNGLDMQVDGRTVRGKSNFSEARTVLTTIPYDKGWKAYIDGKQTEIIPFNDAFVSLRIPKGQHKIEFNYLPYGFIVGSCMFVLCTVLFLCFVKKTQKLKR